MSRLISCVGPAAGTVGFFQLLGYPAIAAYFAMAVETGGGLALILGFYPQVAALLQLPILLGAALGLASRLAVAAEGGRDGRRSTATSSEGAGPSCVTPCPGPTHEISAISAQGIVSEGKLRSGPGLYT